MGLTVEENRRLCETTRGTPMGETLRRYWLPVALAADVGEPGGDPIAVRVLGESYALFRDSAGRLGLLDRLCAHRGASLELARNEDCGLRCLYHGWKIAVDGEVVEMPNLRRPARIRQPSFAVREAGGLIWGYFGPAGTEPTFPEYHWMTKIANGADFWARQVIIDCNWVQLIEGVLDSSHLELLHRDEIQAAQSGALDGVATLSDRFPATDGPPTLDVENTDFGFHYAAIRTAHDGVSRHIRTTSWIAPSTVFIAPGNTSVVYVPISDTETAFYNVSFADEGREFDRDAARRYTGVDRPGVLPWGEDRRFVPPQQDREAMRSGRSFTGVRGITWQDALVNMSQGPIYDRSKEHPTASDAAVVRMRRLLLESASSVERGGAPIGLDRAVDHASIGAGRGVLGPDQSWQSLNPGHVAR